MGMLGKVYGGIKRGVKSASDSVGLDNFITHIPGSGQDAANAAMIAAIIAGGYYAYGAMAGGGAASGVGGAGAAEAAGAAGAAEVGGSVGGSTLVADGLGGTISMAIPAVEVAAPTLGAVAPSAWEVAASVGMNAAKKYAIGQGAGMLQGALAGAPVSDSGGGGYGGGYGDGSGSGAAISGIGGDNGGGQLASSGPLHASSGALPLASQPGGAGAGGMQGILNAIYGNMGGNTAGAFDPTSAQSAYYDPRNPYMVR